MSVEPKSRAIVDPGAFVEAGIEPIESEVHPIMSGSLS